MWRKLDLVFCWTWGALFLVAVLWPYLSSQPLPFGGLRKLSQEGGLALNLEAASVLGAALWFSVRPWHTRDRMRVVQGASIVLALLGLILVGIAYGLAFVFFANLAHQYAVKLPPSSNADGTTA